jgi:hypothetical protein
MNIGYARVSTLDRNLRMLHPCREFQTERQSGQHPSELNPPKMVCSVETNRCR